MKALTLWQPWASLIALGIKRIETRSWSTNYRGPLAIHAAKRPPGVEMLEDGRAGEIIPVDCVGGVQWMRDDPREMLPGFEPQWRMYVYDLDEGPYVLPLGAVVATCNLVDCVPISEPSHSVQDLPRMFADYYGSYLWLDDGMQVVRADEQLPYGNFAPGRFAWTLEDVVALPEPVPAKGRQGLWEWDGVAQ